MLAAIQKAAILRRSGITVPPSPAEAAANDGSVHERQQWAQAPGGDAGRETALREWTAKVNALFVSYVAARAAKSLRDAEEVRQMNELRHLSDSHGWARAASPTRA